MEKKATEIVEEINNLDKNMCNVLVPLLKDTVADYKKINSFLVLIIIVLIICLTGLGVFSMYKLTEQTNKYNEFLSQFEFESDEYVYSQEQDTSDGDSVINSGITVNQP